LLVPVTVQIFKGPTGCEEYLTILPERFNDLHWFLQKTSLYKQFKEHIINRHENSTKYILHTKTV